MEHSITMLFEFCKN